MSDTGDMWREHRRYKQKRNNGREVKALMQLRRIRDRDPRLQFRHADGYKYTISYGNRLASYWPRTGATIFMFSRDTSTHYLNVSQLVERLKGEGKPVKSAPNGILAQLRTEDEPPKRALAPPNPDISKNA